MLEPRSAADHPAVSLILLDNLTRGYGHRRGIEHVSLSVSEGALFGFLGPNGAGKTTTIRVMLGFLRPTTGAASIFGLDCWSDSKAIKRDVGYVPGDLRLPSWINGETALSIFGAVRGQDVMRSGRELAGKFDLELRVKDCAIPITWTESEKVGKDFIVQANPAGTEVRFKVKPSKK